MFEKIKSLFHRETSDYDKWQKEEIETGKGSGIDVSVYSYPEFYAGYMKLARSALEEDASKRAVGFLIQKYLNKEISGDEYEDLIRKAIYVIDISELVERYKIPEDLKGKEKNCWKDVLYGTACELPSIEMDGDFER